MEYRQYIIKRINELDSEWREAMSNGDFGMACIYGEQASKLEMIFNYHESNGTW